MNKLRKILSAKIGAKTFVASLGVLGILGFAMPLALSNFLIDPYFLWGISHRYNYLYESLDERVEKVNRIYYNERKSYDSVLLGSSRATYVNQNDFINHRLFNFGVSSMMPFEYDYYLNLLEQKGHSLKTIYLQIDFFGSNTIMTDDGNTYTKEKLEKVVFAPLENHLHRISKLLTYNKQLIRIPLDNVKKAFTQAYYTRDNIKYHPKVSEEQRIEAFNYHLKRHTLLFMGDKYAFDKGKELKNILLQVKARHPNASFVIYTSPVSVPLFASEINFAKRWEEYKQWLRIHLEVFGSLYQFGGFNEITQNLQNYKDDDHFYPYVGKLIAQTLTKQDFTPIKDFGIYLTLDNVEEYFAKLEKQLKDYDMSEIIEIMNDERLKVF